MEPNNHLTITGVQWQEPRSYPHFSRAQLARVPVHLCNLVQLRSLEKEQEQRMVQLERYLEIVTRKYREENRRLAQIRRQAGVIGIRNRDTHVFGDRWRKIREKLARSSEERGPKPDLIPEMDREEDGLRSEEQETPEGVEHILEDTDPETESESASDSEDEGEPEHMCEECQASFATQQELCEHFRTHLPLF